MARSKLPISLLRHWLNYAKIRLTHYDFTTQDCDLPQKFEIMGKNK